MEGIVVLLVILAIALVVSGPIALIISIVALNKTNAISNRLRFAKPEQHISAPVGPEPKPPEQKAPAPEPPATPKPVKPQPPASLPVIAAIRQAIGPKKAELSLEQRIGTQWILIAGVVTVFAAVAFFLKYAYDNDLIGPFGRVMIAAFTGLIALIIGEVTRRREYGDIAKVVTALGFAILYVAVFSAYYFYHLIDSTPAFVLAILLTATAMLYAVSLNEILIAFIAMLGGFASPIILSTGENLPMQLFTYTVILGVGAMLCGFYRKWRAINALAFAGTFALYIGWFEKFYRPEMKSGAPIPGQMYIALSWLVVFFAVYLILPILYELFKKVKAKKEDVILVLANAFVTFCYLWTILFTHHRHALAFAALGLCAAHLLMMSAVINRCKDDFNLRLSLLAIGLFFLTIAIPLYLKMYAIAIAWAAEGVILALIGLKYKSPWTQLAAVIALLLSLGQLLLHQPIHTAAFTLGGNTAFGTWLFVAAAVILCHILYRRSAEAGTIWHGLVAECYYAAGALILMAACIMEWYAYCDYNTLNNFHETFFLRGMMLISAVFVIVLVIRPVAPKGELNKVLAIILGVIAAALILLAFPEVQDNNAFVIFANTNFALAVVFIASLLFAAQLLTAAGDKTYNRPFAIILGLLAVFTLWILITEQIWLYWYCRNRYDRPLDNWRFLAHMYISISWALYAMALMIIGFWQDSKTLRYISFGIFAILLAKVFIIDTSAVENVYRIAAFAATGITLVGVSYLYQYLRKKGFFDAILIEKTKTTE
jgi:uncharacterized membrane protein